MPALNTKPDTTVEQPAARPDETDVTVPGTATDHSPPVTVVLSIPRVTTAADDVFTERDLGYDVDLPSTKAAPTETAAIETNSARTATAAVVPLSVAESSTLQNYVQNVQQWFVDFAGGSLVWRLFVGSGFAILIGAVTLLVLGPSPEQIRKAAAESTASNLKVVDQELTTKSAVNDRQPVSSNVTLTVGTHQGAAGQMPVEVEDPFIESNRVTPAVRYAVYSSDAAGEASPEVIQRVSQRVAIGRGPAWLSGTIENTGD